MPGIIHDHKSIPSERGYNLSIQNMTRISKIPFYPVLLAIFPVLALYAVNVHEIASRVLWRPLFVSFTGALLLLVVARLILHDWYKASLVTTFFLLLFISYGHLYDFLRTTPLERMNIVRHRYLAILFIIVLIVGLWMILKKMREFKPIAGILNVISVVLVIMPIYQIAAYSINSSRSEQSIQHQTSTSSITASTQSILKPDVYYIILDAYTRADVLKTELGFDNTSFIQQLRGMGFYVADCSRANYNRTELSLTSSFNMSYLPELFTKYDNSKATVRMLIKHSTVRQSFMDLGYEIVAFETGNDWNSMDDVDLYLTRRQSLWGGKYITSFEQMLLESTFYMAFNDLKKLTGWDAKTTVARDQADYIEVEEYILDHLPSVADIPESTFTYAHSKITHDPYVFSPHGYMTDPQEFQFPTGYIYSIEYINMRIIKIIQEILQKSSTPPIIILQGDHGYWKKENPYFQNLSPILSAYYLPGIDSSKLYPSISPVNTFRLIFNEYFGGHYPMLPDESYNISNISVTIPEEYPDCRK